MDMNGATLGSRWVTTARVLLVEDRTCRCGASFSAPSKHTFVRQERLDVTFHSERVVRFEGQFVPPYCPYQVEHAVVRLESCTDCFVQREAYSQREMFPEFQAFPPLPEPEPEIDEKPAKKAVVATPLSAF
ncbi:hypothetical protein CMI37_30305 [Candidatus Pacearchaeota archaeon]|nr:hypothetical protein [Candidatus Pacearchaeota archaeon]